MKMQSLLKTYNLTHESEYYEIIIESFINGQNKQAIEQFKAMPKTNRVAMVAEIAINSNRSIDRSQIQQLIKHI